MMSKQAMLKKTAVALIALSSLAGVAGCSSNSGFTPSTTSTSSGNRVESEAIKIAKTGVELIQDGDFAGASTQFNKALKLDITNSSLQMLNGLAYHLLALKGDITFFPLAAQGYELAIQYDSTNWLAYYYTGLLRMDQRDFVGAQEFFSEAILYKDNDPEILYSMSVSSYYAKDPEMAAAVLEKMREVAPNTPKALQASAMVMAALGNDEEAQKYLTEYEALTGDVQKSGTIEDRLASWATMHDRARLIDTAAKASPVQTVEVTQLETRAAPTRRTPSRDQVNTDGEDNPGDQPAEWIAELNNEEEDIVEDDPYRMVIVDVVIIRTEEDITTSKGVNLLNGLTLQFGGDVTTGLSYTSSKAKTRGDTTKTITRAINIPAITYSLNIANSNTSRNEILARPTLVALAGEQSEFFSGVEVDAAAVGGSNGDGSTIQVQKEIGVKLSLLPDFLDDGRIKLNVVAERTFLTTPNTSSVTFTLRIDTSKTMVSANVVMNFGETLILSGLSEKETERTRDGVPFLQDIPGLQFLFSKRTTRDFQKSVLILMTPRPPSYTYQSDGQLKKAQAKQTQNERSLSELQARYSDWFKPYPNWASVFHHMQNNTLYREFRTGDVTMEHWANQETLKSRLQQAMTFLYY